MIGEIKLVQNPIGEVYHKAQTKILGTEIGLLNRWTTIAVEIAAVTSPADFLRIILQELSEYLAAQLFIDETHSGCPE